MLISVVAFQASSQLGFSQTLMTMESNSDTLNFHKEDVVNVEPTFDQVTNSPVVLFTFSARGAARLADFTTHNIGEVVDVKFCGKTVTEPVIREPIVGGELMLSGSLTASEAHDIAAKFRSGDCQ